MLEDAGCQLSRNGTRPSLAFLTTKEAEIISLGAIASDMVAATCVDGAAGPRPLQISVQHGDYLASRVGGDSHGPVLEMHPTTVAES